MNLYKKAIEKWGLEAQMNMTIEECAELIVALSKATRPTSNLYCDERVDAILDELVDVEIMVEQMKHVFDYKYSNGAVSKFADIKRRKLKRLEKRLNED